MLRLLLLILLAATAPASVALAERPNVVLVMTDDQGYGDVGIHERCPAADERPPTRR